MLIGVLVICLLFIIGLFVGLVSIIIGLKGPLQVKEYLNCCEHCNYRYKWYELIPIFSFFLNKGECKHCNREIPLVFPALELLSGILFSFSFIIYDFSYEMIIMDILTILTLIIFVSDFKYFIILDIPLVIASIVVLALKFIFFGYRTFMISVCSGLVIFILMMMIKFIGDRIFNQESIGGGDIKLAMIFGFMLGIRLSIISLIIGSFLAFPYAIYSALSKINREIPFGPFLIMGLYIVFVFMEPIKNFISIIF